MNRDTLFTQQLSKIYPTGETEVVALDDVSLTFKPGAFASVGGPSGSGKSTFLNLVGGIDSPSAGEIQLGHAKFSSLNPDAMALVRKEKIGFIFQSYNLIPVLTALENVMFPLLILGIATRDANEMAKELLNKVGLSDLVNRRPKSLSGGQQQRVAIARALVKTPSLVLADEPTANLDSKTGEAILTLMAQMNEGEGTSFLFSTHDPMVMNFAKRQVVLKDGRVVEDSAN